MRPLSPAVAVALLVARASCGEDTTLPPEQAGGQGGVGGSGGDPSVGGGAGTLFEGCEPGMAPLDDGGCLAAGEGAGIAPEQCAAGFVADGQSGCEPVLPAQPCAAGTMAVVGETSCREVAPCGTGKWGDIPDLPGTEYVEQGYSNGGNNGDKETPWTTIGEALTAAVPNAIVATTDGDYNESLTLWKPVRLWGRCPSAVTISGAFPITVYDAVEIRDLAVTGNVAIDVVGGSSLIDRVRVHDSWRGVFATAPTTITRSLVETISDIGVFYDGSGGSIEESVVRDTGARAVNFRDDWVHTAVTVRASVIERGTGFGIFIQGADVTIDGSVVRDTEAGVLAQNEFGLGLLAQTDPSTWVRPLVVVSGSLFERNRDHGMKLSGVDGIIEATVVRDTRSGADGSRGRGMLVRRNDETLDRSDVLVRDSLFVGNRDAGIVVWGSDLQLESTVVRDTLPADSYPEGGRGIEIAQSSDPAMPSNGAVVGSLFEGNHSVAINVFGSTLTLETSLVRDTLQTATGFGGRGVSVEGGTLPSTATIRYSVIEDNRDIGIGAIRADLEVESTVVRGHRAADYRVTGGMGIHAESDLANQQDTIELIVRRCLIEDNTGIGIAALKANLTLEGSLVQGILPFGNDTFGDGVVFTGMHGDVSGSVTGCRIEDNARAGLAIFGAPMWLAGSTLACNAIDLNGENDGFVNFTITDGGNNRCGCPPNEVCKVLSTGLTPPSPLDSL